MAFLNNNWVIGICGSLIAALIVFLTRKYLKTAFFGSLHWLKNIFQINSLALRIEKLEKIKGNERNKIKSDDEKLQEINKLVESQLEILRLFRQDRTRITVPSEDRCVLSLLDKGILTCSFRQQHYSKKIEKWVIDLSVHEDYVNFITEKYIKAGKLPKWGIELNGE